jgi:transposase InsO family protein
VLVGFRLRPFTLAEELATCRPRAGYGPRRISAELAREQWGAIRISEHGVWRVLCRVGLNTRAKRLALIARHRDPYERRPGLPPPERHIDATEPGQKVQFDCFYVGRLSGTKATVWQYTAIDVASAFRSAERHSSERNPRSRHTRELLHRVASELAAAGRKQRELTTDNGSESRAKDVGRAVDRLGARQRFIRAGHPNPNGRVERVQLTIPEECRRPAFARSLVPKMTALQRPPRVPHRLQLRPRPYRTPHPRTRARRHRLRRAQDQPRTMTISRHNSGLGRPRPPERAG